MHITTPDRIGKLAAGAALALSWPIAAAPLAAAEDRADSWYVAAGGTRSFLSDMDQEITNAPMPGASIFATNITDAGWGGYAALGRSFGRFRVEAEIGRTENPSSKYVGRSPIVATIPQTGETDIWRYMVNGYVDLGPGHWTLSPYLGAGAGSAKTDVYRFAARIFIPTEPPRVLIDDSSNDFAWQAMAGLAWKASPRLTFTAQYRWLELGTIEIADGRGEPVKLDVGGGHIDVGLRWAF